MDTIEARANLSRVEADIQEATRIAGRPRDSVALLAVSKTHPPEALRRLHAAGQQRFGENYAQELWQKAFDLSDLAISWVFIGALQSNKIQKIVACTAEIQTISSERHVRFVARYAKEFGKTPFPIYLAVNAGGESQKHGLPLDQARPLAAFIAREHPELSLQGIMAVPPPLPPDWPRDPLSVPALYRELEECSRGIGAGKLSLGMSGDLREAIAAGSTTVRIGTALFGNRSYER